MTLLFEIGVANAVLASVLALVVWFVTRIVRQPALAQLLWVLVLVKLVTPPLISIPWRLERAPANMITPIVTSDLPPSSKTGSGFSLHTPDRPIAPNEAGIKSTSSNIPALKLVPSVDGETKIVNSAKTHANNFGATIVDWGVALIKILGFGSAGWVFFAVVVPFPFFPRL